MYKINQWYNMIVYYYVIYDEKIRLMAKGKMLRAEGSPDSCRE